eukprot:jgi/Botrbrau1/676/Bobra.160_2s0001.1
MPPRRRAPRRPQHTRKPPRSKVISIKNRSHWNNVKKRAGKKLITFFVKNTPNLPAAAETSFRAILGSLSQSKDFSHVIFIEMDTSDYGIEVGMPRTFPCFQCVLVQVVTNHGLL